jgi:hypothetical protein
MVRLSPTPALSPDLMSVRRPIRIIFGSVFHTGTRRNRRGRSFSSRPLPRMRLSSWSAGRFCATRPADRRMRFGACILTPVCRFARASQRIRHAIQDAGYAITAPPKRRKAGTDAGNPTAEHVPFAAGRTTSTVSRRARSHLHERRSRAGSPSRARPVRSEGSAHERIGCEMVSDLLRRGRRPSIGARSMRRPHLDRSSILPSRALQRTRVARNAPSSIGANGCGSQNRSLT